MVYLFIFGLHFGKFTWFKWNINGKLGNANVEKCKKRHIKSNKEFIYWIPSSYVFAAYSYKHILFYDRGSLSSGRILRRYKLVLFSFSELRVWIWLYLFNYTVPDAWGSVHKTFVGQMSEAFLQAKGNFPFFWIR